MSVSGKQASTLLDAAQGAAEHSYAPYSQFSVGAALLFADGSVVTGTNVENASYGLALCAETIAVAKAMADGRRGGLVAVAVTGPDDSAAPITPCGRCRQVLYELAALDRRDPVVLRRGPGGADAGVHRTTLSALLPDAFGPSNLV